MYWEGIDRPNIANARAEVFLEQFDGNQMVSFRQAALVVIAAIIAIHWRNQSAMAFQAIRERNLAAKVKFFICQCFPMSFHTHCELRFNTPCASS
jgi:hypothetical protein